MNRNLILQGAAGEALGEKWSVNAPTIGDAFAVVHANNPKKFMDYFGKDNGQGEFIVKVAGEALEENELLMYNLEGEDIIVTPVPKGSKMSAGEKILLAVVIIIIAIYAPQWIQGTADAVAAEGLRAMFQMAAIMTGLNLAIMGITEMMVKAPSNDADEQGAMFSGPATTIKQGQPVPIAYGKVMVGGTPITTGFGNYKLEPTNGYHFLSDNPDAWDGVIYEGGATNSGSDDDTTDSDSTGGSDNDTSSGGHNDTRASSDNTTYEDYMVL